MQAKIKIGRCVIEEPNYYKYLVGVVAFGCGWERLDRV